VIGYWGGQSEFKTPDEVTIALAKSVYNQIGPGGMTFTMDRKAFPALAGNRPEHLLDSGANIVGVVYSEGWGIDDLGAAFLYFAQDECGGFYWHGLVFSATHFD